MLAYQSNGSDTSGDRAEYERIVAALERGPACPLVSVVDAVLHLMKRAGPPAEATSDQQAMREAVEMEGAIPNRTVRDALRFLLSTDAPSARDA